MHCYNNAGLNGLKSPAQRSGKFSELGSAQLSSKSLGSCWTLDLPLDWIGWEPDIIEKFSSLPFDWIEWELNIMEMFSPLPSDCIEWEPDIIE